MRRIVSALVAAMGLAVGVAQAQRCPDRLRVAFPDAPAEPFVRGQGGEFASPPGLLVDWVRAALRDAGCEDRAQFMRLPSRRVGAMVQAGQLDLVAGVGDAGPLAALLVLPPRAGPHGEFDLSVGVVDYALYARRGRAPGWDGRQLTGLGDGARVGATAGSRAEALARERGWPLDAAPSHESALQKLVAGRTPLLLVHSYYLDQRLQRDPQLARQIVKLAPTVERRRLHVGALPALAQASPGFLAVFWRAVCRQSQAARMEGACRPPP